MNTLTLPDWATTRSHREGDCLIWDGLTRKGYARINGAQASRRIYTETVGPIPSGLELDHLCKQPLCINPQHLEPVTRTENMRRRYASYTRCVNGHDLTPENTYAWGTRSRACKTCRTEATRRYRARRQVGAS